MPKTITIALCGSQPRIGTTTQAFQILQYLQMRGYEVAYIDLSGKDYIDQLCRLYGGVEKTGSCVIHENIHMYHSALDLGADYQYVVKDYGSVKDDSFNATSYLEQDVHIVCSGVKPNEIFEVTYVLKKPEFNHAKFIFSFVPPDHRSGILKQMTNRATNTFFVGYNPDPFSYDATNNKAFRQILGTFLSEEMVSSQKKVNLFLKVCRTAKGFLSILKNRLITPGGIAAVICSYTVLLLIILFRLGFLNI